MASKEQVELVFGDELGKELATRINK